MTDHAGVAPPLARALKAKGYETLTPVQQAVLGPAMGEGDALVSAQTGSGKTVAFGLAIAPTLLGADERFLMIGAPLALVVAPTRELAMQIKRELQWLYEETNAVIASCVGGMDMRSERRALERGAHIVVGTPGRLRDHISRNALDMSALRAVVLDEADEMLDLGFREDLEFILDAAPAERRTLLFSATVSPGIARLAKRYQRDAARIETISEQSQHVDIEYRALVVAPTDRENAIINVLRFHEARNALVFCGTRAAVNHLSARLGNRGFSVVALSGELSQSERTHALQAMRDGRARVCVATDVAARGIDLPNLELVIHADLPSNREALLHRSGRTGRAGRKGVSAVIVPYNARRKAERLLDEAGVVAEWAPAPSADEVSRRDDERDLADPSLAAPVAEDEAEFVGRLLEQHTPDRLAAAYLRLLRAGRSAPEELVEVRLEPPRKRSREDAPPREDFSGGRWFSLDVGRNRGAEPRWLIPALCEAGGLVKNDIGAIKMRPEETYIEISAAAADRFMEAIGPRRMVGRDVRVTPLDGPPNLARGPNAAHRRNFEKAGPGKGAPGKGGFGKGGFGKGGFDKGGFDKAGKGGKGKPGPGKKRDF